MLNNLINKMKQAIAEVGQWPEKTVQVYHHNDADGITSGAILTRAFERQGFTVQRFCLEKPYPAVLKKVYEQEGRLIIFADFAGRIAPMISELNKGRNLTLNLDHHVAEASTDPMVHNLDPDLYGLKGDRDISGSTTCYLFAVTMDAANHDLAQVGVSRGEAVNGRTAGVAGNVAAQNKPAEPTTLFRNSGSGSFNREKVPTLGDQPLVGRMLSRDKDGVEALGRRGGETAKVQEHYYADYSMAEGGRFDIATNAIVADAESNVTLGYEFSKKLAGQTWDESRKKTEALGKDLANLKAGKPGPDELALQKVDPTTGLPVGTVCPLDPSTGTAVEANQRG